MDMTPIPGAAPVPSPAPGPQPFRLIREARAAKLGARSTGRITFQILTDEARQALFIRISHNEGGGYISDEAVSLHAIRRCVNECGEELLKAASFISAFRGRSSNNPGALAAALVHERLIKRDATRPHLFDDGDESWQAWATRELATPGELPIVLVGKLPHKPVAPVRKKAVADVADAASSEVTTAADAGSGDNGSVDPDVAADSGEATPKGVSGKVRKGRITLRG